MQTGKLRSVNADGTTAYPISSINSTYTIYVATTGSDSTGTGSASAPFLTVAKALAYLNSFYLPASIIATISIGLGTFAQTGSLSILHSCGASLSVVGTTSAGNAQSINSANTTTLTWNGVNSNGIILYNSRIGTLSNLYVVGGTAGNNNANTGMNLSAATIYNASMLCFQYWAYGVIAAGGSNVTGTSIAALNTTNYGLYSANASIVGITSAYVSTAYIGVLAGSGSTLNLTSSTLTTNTYGAFCQVNSIICGYQVSFLSNSAYCIDATDCAAVVSQSGTYTSNGNSNAPTPAWNTVGNTNSFTSNTSRSKHEDRSQHHRQLHRGYPRRPPGGRRSLPRHCHPY